ncbi:MAG: cation:proton antiporter [Micavibrio sp.]
MQSASFISHFSDLLLLLGVAGLTIPFLRKFKISPVLGFLICGVVLGPHGLLPWIDKVPGVSVPVTDGNKVIQSFAELGVIFLMFMIGLKLSLKDLWRMRLHIAGLGGLQIIVTALVIGVIARAFGNTLEISILLGACFALSSTAVVMQLFEERKAIHSPSGNVCFSILLMQDLAVVPILTMLNVFAASSGQSIGIMLIKSLIIAILAVMIIYVMGMKVLRPLLKYLHADDHSEWLMSFVLFVVIGAAMITEMVGLSAALGAFLAGLLMAETEKKSQIEHIIAPVKGLLLGIFFFSVGMIIDPVSFLANPLWIVASVIGIGLLKASLLFVLCRLFRLGSNLSAQVAIMLGQSGEFVFVIMALALVKGIIPPQDAQFFMIVTAFSMMMTPFIAGLAPMVGNIVEKLMPQAAQNK